MKTISAVISCGILILLLASTKGFAQQAGESEPVMIKAFPIDITVNKTSNLVFPFAIKGVDKGSRDVLVQKAKGAGNILQLKAASENFQQTNLTVITADGCLHSFTVNYNQNPAALNLNFSGNQKQPSQEAMVSLDTENEAEIESTASLVAEKSKTINKIRDKKFGITLQLRGIYIHHDVMYYQLAISNDTHIGYDIGQLRFFVGDKKRSKRTAAQQLEILPRYIAGNTQKVEGNTESVLVFALPKQTIPDKKYMAVQLMEGNGGRHLKLKLNNKTLVKALLFEH